MCRRRFVIYASDEARCYPEIDFQRPSCDELLKVGRYATATAACWQTGDAGR